MPATGRRRQAKGEIMGGYAEERCECVRPESDGRKAAFVFVGDVRKIGRGGRKA